jgi:hypothetical protein
MTRARSRTWWIASAGAAASIAMTAIATILLVLNGHGVFLGFNPHLIVVGTLYAAIGWLIATRLPGNRIGWVILSGSLLWVVAFVTAEYGWFAVHTHPGLLPGGVSAAWIGTWAWIPGTGLVMTGLPLLFPDGRLPSRRWRPVVAMVGLGTVVATVAQAIAFWPSGDVILQLGTANASSLPGPIGVADRVGQMATFFGPIAGAGAVLLRLRRSTGVERLQMRWLAYAMVVTAVASPLDLVVTSIGWTVRPSIVGVAFIAVAIGVAILRYRLYEIDRIISRTVSYGAVTGILAVVFVGTILVSQTVLSGFFSGNSVAVAASTLVVAGLFQPLRRRVQSVVDRRFNRARYDAERTVSAFAAGLRDEVALADVDAAIRTVVEQTVAPTVVGLWMRERGPS